MRLDNKREAACLVDPRAPGVRYDRVETGPSQAHELTPQQRHERLEELVHVFAAIFVGLTPEQRARYMSEDTERQSEPPNDEHAHHSNRG